MKKIKQIVIVICVLFICNISKAQFPKFELKDAAEKQTKNYVVYLTASWCKPCMDGLREVIDSFKNDSNYKLVIWFERGLTETQQLMQRLKNKYGDSLFYLFPIRYYSQKYKLISINPQNKVLKKIMNELNATGKIKLKWGGDLTWGKLFIINKDTVAIAKSLNKKEQIIEIKKIITNTIKF